MNNVIRILFHDKDGKELEYSFMAETETIMKMYLEDFLYCYQKEVVRGEVPRKRKHRAGRF